MRISDWSSDVCSSDPNIRAHYDLGNDFYAQWLDPSMTYSSARFGPADTLEEAQRAKWQALARRIGNPATVLEIGCGWGSMANHLQQGGAGTADGDAGDRKSTRLNSSH